MWRASRAGADIPSRSRAHRTSRSCASASRRSGTRPPGLTSLNQACRGPWRPRGRFDHHRGGPRQLRIAGGVGVTPFLSLLHAAERDGLPSQVDFFYSNAGIPPFADELQAAASRHQSMRLHLDQHTRGGPPQRPARSADPRRRPPRAHRVHVRSDCDASRLPAAAASSRHTRRPDPPRVLRLALRLSDRGEGTRLLVAHGLFAVGAWLAPRSVPRTGPEVTDAFAPPKLWEVVVRVVAVVLVV
jgi:hypothetical protein